MPVEAAPAPAPPVALFLRLLPTVALVVAGWSLAWRTEGSFRGPDWLGYAAGIALVLSAVLLAGAALRPRRVVLAAGGLLLALAAWTAISIGWSPLPTLGRDEALLIAFYAVAFLVPALTLRSEAERIGAVALVVLGLGSLAVAASLKLRLSGDADSFAWRRMAFPITYPNALAAMLLVGFWPAIGLAAGRRIPVLVRGLAMGSAAALLADLLLAQSKGGALGLGVSGIAFFAVCRRRLRALVPTAVVAGVVATQAVTLTEPYRASSDGLSAAIRHGGAVAVGVAAVSVAAGVVYALVDRRVSVPGRVRRVAAIVVAAALVGGAAAGAGLFFASVDRPGHYFADRWRSFKHLPTRDRASTHFFSLGSNRYDFWRVALLEFERHPLAGIGARGFSNAYLVEGRSSETPARAHSLEMDTLSETGIVGLVLLLSGGVLVLVACWPWARRSLAGAGVLAAGIYFAAHTGVDWVWTIPEVGLPAFVLLGAGASWPGESARPLPFRASLPAGIVALVLALLVFAPPWIAGRLVDRAYSAGGPSAAAGDLRWARRLDPLSTDPYVAEALIAGTPGDVAPLERAVEKEPRREDLRYLLGTAYLRAGRKAAARRELRAALRLYPVDDLARQALARAK